MTEHSDVLDLFEMDESGKTIREILDHKHWIYAERYDDILEKLGFYKKWMIRYKNNFICTKDHNCHQNHHVMSFHYILEDMIL